MLTREDDVVCCTSPRQGLGDLSDRPASERGHRHRKTIRAVTCAVIVSRVNVGSWRR